MSGVEKVSPWNVERGEGRVGSEEGAGSRPQGVSRTRPPMRGSGRGRVSGRRRQTGRCGEGTRGRLPSACSLPAQIAPPPGECGLKGPSSWSCPSWGPPLSGCSSITRCPTGVKLEKAALVPTPESCCWCRQPSTPSWAEHPLLMTWAGSKSPIPELLP